jgi:hypothetical protein
MFNKIQFNKHVLINWHASLSYSHCTCILCIILCLAGQTGKISWSNNWVAFMDNMLQAQLLQYDTRSLFVPTSIQKLTIDVKRHATCLHALGDASGELGECHTLHASFGLWAFLL